MNSDFTGSGATWKRLYATGDDSGLSSTWVLATEDILSYGNQPKPVQEDRIYRPGYVAVKSLDDTREKVSRRLLFSEQPRPVCNRKPSRLELALSQQKRRHNRRGNG